MTTPQPSRYAQRARFMSVEDGFNIARPALAPRHFDAERDRALDPATPSGWIALDSSAVLRTNTPATSPLLLAKYGRIRAGAALRDRLAASAEIYCVIQGRGRTVRADATLEWAAGDIFCLPGGVDTVHEALTGDCVLFAVTDEPMLAFAGLQPSAEGQAPIEAVQYPAAMIAAELAVLCGRTLGPDTPGRALFLTSAAMERRRTCTPALTLTLNAVLPSESQPPHRHNAAAIVFVIQGGPCASSIGGAELPWTRNSVLLTPPNTVHSHANTGDTIAVALIVQDGGLHYHCRTMGFEFA